MKDDLYVKTLKKYGEDVDLLIERMKDQTFSMNTFYLDELVNIEVSVLFSKISALKHIFILVIIRTKAFFLERSLYSILKNYGKNYNSVSRFINNINVIIKQKRYVKQ